VESLSYLFSLTNSTVAAILREKNLTPSFSGALSPERESQLLQLKRYSVIPQVKQKYKLTDDDIRYIFERSALDDYFAKYLLLSLEDREDVCNSNINLQEELSTLGDMNEELHNQLSGLQSENTSLYSQLSALTQEKHTLNKEIEGLKSSLNQYNGLSLSYQTDLAKYQSEISEMKGTLEKLILKNRGLEADSRKLHDSIDKKQEQFDSLLSEVKSLREKNESLLATQTELFEKNSDLELRMYAMVSRLSADDKKKIVDYYVSHNYRLTKKGLEEFKLQTGINLTDSGFRFVCKQQGVYKRRGRKKK
jgi:chromosome segregation ATPase